MLLYDRARVVYILSRAHTHVYQIAFLLISHYIFLLITYIHNIKFCPF